LEQVLQGRVNQQGIFMIKKSSFNGRTSPVLEGTQKKKWWRKLPNFFFWVVKLVDALTKLLIGCTALWGALKAFAAIFGGFTF
jgi:hypothetical protein